MNMNIRNNVNFFAPAPKSEGSEVGGSHTASLPIRLDEFVYKVRGASADIVGTLSQAVQRNGSPVYAAKLATMQELVKGVDKTVNALEGLSSEDAVKEAEVTHSAAPSA